MHLKAQLQIAVAPKSFTWLAKTSLLLMQYLIKHACKYCMRQVRTDNMILLHTSYVNFLFTNVRDKIPSNWKKKNFFVLTFFSLYPFRFEGTITQRRNQAKLLLFKTSKVRSYHSFSIQNWMSLRTEISVCKFELFLRFIIKPNFQYYHGIVWNLVKVQTGFRFDDLFGVRMSLLYDYNFHICQNDKLLFNAPISLSSENIWQAE